jgi:hypothetical protein
MAKKIKRTKKFHEEYGEIFTLMETNPVGLRRKIATTGFFAVMPIDGEDDFRLDEQTFIRMVFRWVLDRALLDVLGGAKLEDQKEAYFWVFKNDPSFEDVCDYADLDPSIVRTAFYKMRKSFLDAGVLLFSA